MNSFSAGVCQFDGVPAISLLAHFDEVAAFEKSGRAGVWTANLNSACLLGANQYAPHGGRHALHFHFLGGCHVCLNSKLRRAIRTRGHFPSDDAAAKLLYLVLNHAAADWKRPPREWFEAKTQFAVMFKERFVLA